jgi:2-phosphosulfolactate phosphatase
VRFEWGEGGIDALGPRSELIIVVDVLSFSTCVDVAVNRGATILPYASRDATADRYARRNGAVLANRKRGEGDYSLSPASFARIPSGKRVMLPSPNGAALACKAARCGVVVNSCLRNAAAAAQFANRQAGEVAVIACGERWPDDSLRPAWEDLVGAGAVIAHLIGPRSPEAESACAAFRQAEGNLPRLLHECSSGRELIERGFADDVELAAAYGISRCVPMLVDRAFVDRAP